MMETIQMVSIVTRGALAYSFQVYNDINKQH